MTKLYFLEFMKNKLRVLGGDLENCLSLEKSSIFSKFEAFM